MTLRVVIAAIALAALVNIAPLLLYNIGGDINFHLVLVKCFAEQFWQGDLYPRWCFEANTGLGSAAPLFYFPLPYYAATLVYPLSYLGISIHGIYTLSLFLATVLTALTCYFWLKDIVSPERALLVSLLFIFMPYRMEVMLFRSAYAEVWGMALLPLVFKYVRRLGISSPSGRGWRAASGLRHAEVALATQAGEGGATTICPHPTLLPSGDGILPLSAMFGLLFITHLPTAAVAILAGGIYLLVMIGKAWRPKWQYAVSVLWGIALAAFYVVPALYYKQFLFDAPLFVAGHTRGWPNTFLGINNLIKLGHFKLLVIIGAVILALAALSLTILRGRARIEDSFVRRELMAWSLLLPVALFLLFSISEPVYALLGPLRQVMFPWRVQNVFMLALAFLLAVWMQWFVTARRMNTWKGDYAMLLALLALAAHFIAGIREDKDMESDAKVLAASTLVQLEYRSIWTDDAHFNADYIVSRNERRKAIPDGVITSGKGNIAVEQWAWGGITLKAQSTHGVTIRLNHLYFPVWRARADDGEPVVLYPEDKTGQMLLDIPAGRHRIVLQYSIFAEKPWLIWFADSVSALAALILSMLFYCRRLKISLL